ncbi:MAG: DUF4249 domain-containing protein [Bacteroidetes bacterium]|nr:DUF4249 domain-containing protein [Bacteroidota bacterium]
MELKLPYGPVLLLTLMMVLAEACTEQFDLVLDSTGPGLVVEGAITTDSVRHRVLLTITSDYFSNRPPSGIPGATVEISFDEKTILLEESGTESGLYETPYAFRGIPGTTYDLDISQVDLDGDGEYEQYYASSTMPGGAELHSIDLRHFPTPVLSGYVVFMYANHPPEQRDWFGFKFRKNGKILTDSLSQYRVMTDDLFDDGYFPGFPVGFLNDENPRQALHPGDTVTLELNSIEQGYFDYITGAQLELGINYPLFSGPPANPHTNIDNGAFGIFTAYSILRVSTVLH